MKKLFVFLSACILSISVYSQRTENESLRLLYATNHNESIKVNEYFKFTNPNVTFVLHAGEINQESLKNIDALVILGPRKPLSENEKQSILEFLSKGGSLFLGIDQERRTPLNNYNDIIAPYGMTFSEDIPSEHNCGAKAIKSNIMSEEWEIPYSGGRSVIGGTPLAKVLMDEEYFQSSYIETQFGGKIIAMAEIMPAILMGTKDGMRLTGTKPSDTKYWGKDSKNFMKEVLGLLLE